jgi:phosphatidylglycerophosphate synthase
MLGVIVTSGLELTAGPISEQLRAAGVDKVVAVPDLAGLAGMASTAQEPLLICSDDLVAHTAVFRHLATNPAGTTVALVVEVAAGSRGERVREERGRLVPGEPNAAFGGALRVDPPDLPHLMAAARGRVGVGLDSLPAALRGVGVTVFTQRVRQLVAARARDGVARAAAQATIAEIHPEEVELRLAVRERDDLVATYLVSSWSPRLAGWAARVGIGPNSVTAASVALVAAAALLFWAGGRPALLLGAVLLYLGFVLDRVDGQLARYTRRFSPFGGWLDAMSDRVKEAAVYAGLAAGAQGQGWALAVGVLVLIAVRQQSDTWYLALHDEAAARATPSTGRLGRLSHRVQSDHGSPAYWLKQTALFPVGARWAVIAVCTALADQRVALVAVLVCAAVSAAYTLVLRTARALSMRVPVFASTDPMLYRDDGAAARLLHRWAVQPLAVAVFAVAAAAVALLVARAGGNEVAVVAVLALVLAAALGAWHPHDGPLDWLVPAALRAAELLFVLAVGVAYEVPAPVVYLLVAALALHHADFTTRLEKRLEGPPLHRLGLGWDGRAVVLVIGVFAGAATAAFAMLGLYLVALVVVDAWRTWSYGAAGR